MVLLQVMNSRRSECGFVVETLTGSEWFVQFLTDTHLIPSRSRHQSLLFSRCWLNVSKTHTLRFSRESVQLHDCVYTDDVFECAVTPIPMIFCSDAEL